MIIWILFAIVFSFLLAKAILETIWGTCLIVYGIACHILAAILDLTAMTIRLAKKLRRKPLKVDSVESEHLPFVTTTIVVQPKNNNIVIIVIIVKVMIVIV